jgi:hypothetical protein
VTRVLTPFGYDLGHDAHEIRVHNARPDGTVRGLCDEVDYTDFEFPH